MESDFLTASLISLTVNLGYTIIALLVGMAALVWVDKKLLKHIDIEEELKKGNMAVALFASTILLFVAIIVAFGFRS